MEAVSASSLRQHHAIPYLERRRGNVVGPKVKGAATSEVKTRVMPMAGQDAVFDRASMERKSKMGTPVVEGKHLFSSSNVATRMKSVEWVVERSLIRILDISRNRKIASKDYQASSPQDGPGDVLRS